jgi:hypothetical protein
MFCGSSSFYTIGAIYYEDLSSGSRVIPCGRTDETNMTKQAAAFRNSYAKVPKIYNSVFLNHYNTHIHLKKYTNICLVYQIILQKLI